MGYYKKKQIELWHIRPHKVADQNAQPFFIFNWSACMESRCCLIVFNIWKGLADTMCQENQNQFQEPNTLNH